MNSKFQREGDFREIGSSNPPAKKQYIIIADSSMSRVVTEVEEALNLGWKCQGGIYVTYNSVGGYLSEYYQAMTKN